MKFTAIDVPAQAGAVYRSERYDLIHKVAGFGIVLVEVWCRGNNRKLTEFTGHTALKLAMKKQGCFDPPAICEVKRNGSASADE